MYYVAHLLCFVITAAFVVELIESAATPASTAACPVLPPTKSCVAYRQAQCTEGSCENGLICCDSSCAMGNVCVHPVRPGTCPTAVGCLPQSPANLTKSTCRQDYQCTVGTQKCCAGCNGVRSCFAPV